MSYPLVPKGIFNIIHVSKYVGLSMSGLFTLILIFAYVFYPYPHSELGPFGILCGLWAFLIIVMTYPWALNQKNAYSVVKMDEIGISVYYKKACWRVIPWTEINDIQIKNIKGFFYGKNQDSIECKYVCFFIGKNTEIPAKSYSEKFNADGFFMMNYHPDLEELIMQYRAEDG